ncbi:hypothetical protein CJ195_07400 [Bacillus sp. UMB0899]|uniref:hypothetical protein n=1 Tax=Metabacillus schmidteae TaxID=2730405 RepID=UPI000C807485|nr:hypothetical protein [Metabacillus schmidteae]PMC39733.1 hypothetical protein CJ195_07400 [Bacillus sp. UMB0899]
MKTRHDAWTFEHDKLLAETVLSYVQNSRTQSAAFKDVGKQLNRTAAACNYRWNAELRKKYTKEMEHAKKRRKEPPLNKEENKPKEETQLSQLHDITQMTVDDCIRYLSQVRNQEEHHHIINENKQLQEENKKLNQQRQELNKRYEQLVYQKQKMDRHYKMFFGLINEAQNKTEEKQLYH